MKPRVAVAGYHYNKYDLLRQIPLDIRAIRRYGSFYVTFSIGQYSLVTKMSCPSLKSTWNRHKYLLFYITTNFMSSQMLIDRRHKFMTNWQYWFDIKFVFYELRSGCTSQKQTKGAHASYHCAAVMCVTIAYISFIILIILVFLFFLKK